MLYGLIVRLSNNIIRWSVAIRCKYFCVEVIHRFWYNRDDGLNTIWSDLWITFLSDHGVFMAIFTKLQVCIRLYFYAYNL